MKKIGIIIPVLNQFELAIKALESIKISKNFNYQIFIIDNWSENQGVAKSWNLGVKKAIENKCDYFLILNDDIILSPYTIEHMCNIIEYDDIALVTATDYKHTHTSEQIKDLEKQNHEIDILDAPDFACFLISNETYEKIGEFDEGLYPAYFEDNDYCYRIILSGLKCIRSQNSVFYHYGSQTQNSGERIVSHDEFDKNKEYYKNKWGGEPGAEVHTHPWNNYSLNWTATKQNSP